MAAAYRGNMEIAQTLLANGANASARTAKGTTASTLAAAQGHTALAEYLTEKERH